MREIYSVEVESPEDLDVMRGILDDSFLNCHSSIYSYPTGISVEDGVIRDFGEEYINYSFDEWKALNG